MKWLLWGGGSIKIHWLNKRLRTHTRNKMQYKLKTESTNTCCTQPTFKFLKFWRVKSDAILVEPLSTAVTSHPVDGVSSVVWYITCLLWALIHLLIQTIAKTTNTMSCEQTFAWLSRFKKVICAMPKTHFHFFLHRMIKRRNLYITYCYANNRRPLQPSIKVKS